MSKAKFTLLAILAIIAVSCKNNDQEPESVVEVSAIELKDTTCTISYYFPATLTGIQDVSIYPQVSGRITKVRVVEGQYVNKGDILFDIDDVPYKAAYDAALAQVEVSKAQLETAKLTYKSKENLFNKDIISSYQLDLAKNEVTTAEAVLGQSEASLKKASNELSFTKVRTMGEGYIGALPYKVGSLVGSTLIQPLTVVSNNSSIYADFSITENMYLELADEFKTDASAKENGKEIELELITNLGEKFENKGRLHSVSGVISNETGSIQTKAIYPNPDHKLLSGGSGKVVLNIERSGLIVIPRAAMKEIQDKCFVFVIKDGVLSQTEVKASRLNSSQWAILPGEDGEYALKAGDVITSTTNRLNDGDKVIVKK